MTTLSTSELTELAKRVYPDRQVEFRDGRVYVRPSCSSGKLPDMIPFFPFLDRAQAYDCIVAAFTAFEVVELYKDGTKYQFSAIGTHIADNILQVACRALLVGDGK